MLSHARTQALAEILSLTISETEAAEAGAWEQVRSLDRRRLELMNNFFSTPPEASERDVLGEQLRELVREDARLLEVATTARDGVASKVARQRQQRSGVAAYREAHAHR
ncbi:MAG: flagellar protein FliT [Pseudomonadota bacterium]